MSASFAVIGDMTGKRWAYEQGRELPFGGAGHRYLGANTDDERVLLHFLASDLRPAEIERARLGVEIGHLPAIAGHPNIRRVLDVSEVAEYGLWVIYEWADRSLQDLLNTLPPTEVPEPALATAVEHGVRSALDALHGLGYVHCDVAPNNILDVSGVWKLADLEGCVPAGAAVERFAPAPYASADARAGEPALTSMDWYGLARVLDRLRGR